MEKMIAFAEIAALDHCNNILIEEHNFSFGQFIIV